MAARRCRLSYRHRIHAAVGQPDSASAYEFRPPGRPPLRNGEKPYADALELAESVAEGVEGKIIYCIDDEKIKKSKLKGMSTKNIRSVSVNEMDGTKIVRLETDKYRSDWISVTGVVTDEEGKTIAATVLVKGTNDYTVADADGRFNLKAPKNGILRIADVNKSVAEVKVKPMLKVVLKDK